MFNSRTKRETFPVTEVLAVASAIDRAQGFVKVGDSYYDSETEVRVEDNRTIALRTLRLILLREADAARGDSDYLREADGSVIIPTQDDYAQAKVIYDHFDEILVLDKLSDDLVKHGANGRVNDFNYMLNEIFAAGESDTSKQLAMLVSLPNSYRVSIKRKEMEDFYRDNRENGYIGEVKNRLKITGRVIDVKFIPRHSIYLTTVFTTDGQLAKFFMNQNHSDVAARIVDTDITFVGTVKKQDVNTFTKCQETMFNRVKIQ